MLCEEPVCPGTLQDNLPGRTRTFIEKHTVTYTSFCLQTNQICIILSTEVLPYPGTYPRTICVPIVVLSKKMHQENVSGKIPWDVSRGTKVTPTTDNHKINAMK